MRLFDQCHFLSVCLLPLSWVCYLNCWISLADNCLGKKLVIRIINVTFLPHGCSGVGFQRCPCISMCSLVSLHDYTAHVSQIHDRWRSHVVQSCVHYMVMCHAWLHGCSLPVWQWVCECMTVWVMLSCETSLFFNESVCGVSCQPGSWQQTLVPSDPQPEGRTTSASGGVTHLCFTPLLHSFSEGNPGLNNDKWTFFMAVQ